MSVRRRRDVQRPFRQDPDAVSDVIGSILLVGITVVLVAAFSLVILNLPGPVDQVHAELRLSISPGTGGWDTGDETIRVKHLSGEPLLQRDTRIILTFAGLTEVYEGSALQGAFADGSLSIGETWSVQKTLAEDDVVAIDVVGPHGGGQSILASARLSGLSVEATNCLVDTTPPTVAVWNQFPQDVATGSTGPVLVQVQVSDDCAGVDTAVHPTLRYRINDGSDPAFQSAGPMSLAGGAQWTGTIPTQTWASLEGRSLEYYLAGLQDQEGNTGDSTVQQDVIQTGDPCATDVDPPVVVLWAQSPADVTASTLGGVTVTATIADSCAGVDTGVDPTLRYRINGGSNPAYSTVAMTPSGTNQWQATIPSPLGTWALHPGKTLEYFVGGMQDLKGNAGASGVQSDVIQVLPLFTYATSANAVTGSVSDFANLQAANGNVATVLEGGVATGGAATLSRSANGVHSNPGGWTNPSFAFASDDIRATITKVNPNGAVRYELANPSGQAGTITGVVLKAEGFSDNANGRWRLMGCVGATCGAQSGQLAASVNNDGTVTYDITSGGAKPNTGSAWTWADITALRIDVDAEGTGNADFFLDHAWVEVTYEEQTYATEVEVEIAGVPLGLAYHLELRYRTAGDTFVVEVWDGTAWSPRGSTLNSASLTTWTYSLTATEYNAGSPLLRFIDQTPAGTTQGSLQLDYVRVLTT